MLYTVLNKQGPQGSHKLSSLKSLKIQNPSPKPGILTPAQPSEMASFSNLGGKTVKNVQIDPLTILRYGRNR